MQVSDLRIVLKVVRTVLRCFHRQLRAKAGVFVEGLIAGTPRSACCLKYWTGASPTKGYLVEPSPEQPCNPSAFITWHVVGSFLFHACACNERCKLQYLW